MCLNNTERLPGESMEGISEQVNSWDSQAHGRVMLKGFHSNQEMTRIWAGIRWRDQGPPNCSFLNQTAPESLTE